MDGYVKKGGWAPIVLTHGQRLDVTHGLGKI